MDNKLNRRSRPRPHDLRRKVLLKNFLQEQMTYLPHVQLTTHESNQLGEDFSVEASNSSELNDLSELNDENTSATVSSVGSSDSIENMEEDVFIPNVNEHKSDSIPTESVSVNNIDPPSESKFFRFSSFMNLRSGLKKKKSGILKAKKICKTIKSPVKSKLRSFKFGRSKASNDRSSHYATRSSSKSLFSMFKVRKQQRKSKAKQSPNAGVNSSYNVNEETCTSNQSVQTEDNWALNELSKVEESNKLLKEENRLLSESLSYFMSSNSLDSHMNRWSSPLQSTNRKMNSMRRYTGCYDNLSSCSTYGYEYENWNRRSRVTRSKSVHEESSRDISNQNAYWTRSMNFHKSRSEFYAASTPPTASFSQVSTAQSKRKNVLTNLPVNSTGRVVQRRSSMPERTWSENDRSRICRRTGSMRDTRTPFHALPSEAFY